MVSTCFLCKWRSDKLPRRSYHKFPSANELKQKWLNILGKSNVSIGKRTSLCSLHFDENCFRYGLVKGRKILKDGSLPTLHLTKDAIESQTIHLVDKILLPASLTESTLPMLYSSVDVIQMEDTTSKLDIEGKLVQVPMEISMGSFHKRGPLNLPSKENEILCLKTKETKLKRSGKRLQDFKHNKKSQLTELKKTCAYEIDKNLMHAPSSTGDTADAGSGSETSDASSHQESSPKHENLEYWKWLPEAQTEDKNPSNRRTAPIHSQIGEWLADSQTRDRSNSTTEDLTELNKQALQVTVARIEANPQLYIGIPKNCYHLVDLIRKGTGIPTIDILLCLKKVKLDTQFEELADQFGILASKARQIFVANIPLIANTLRSFIVSLDNSAEAVQNNLPIPFRNNHLNPTCIVVSLELQIQPINQAETSKENESIKNNLTQIENGNTVKYLISTSPDGFIDYVSPGYGGRISDEMLIKDTKFLDKLKPGSCIVTKKAFRNVEQILANRGLHLLKPGETLRPKSGLILSDKVKVSLETHVERVFQRLSEFSIVNEYSAISSDLVRVVDDTVVISCALINLQGFFIN